MSRYHAYLNSAISILSVYTGEEPLASFLKKYFAQHKKFGSKDRKQVSHLCYCFFRLGKALQEFPLEERLLIALFFCSTTGNEVLRELRPEWNDKTGLPIAEKCSMLNAGYPMLSVFPWKEELSEGIDHAAFSGSFFIQPDLFLRARPGKEMTVRQKLETAGITFQQPRLDCFALPNASKIDDVIAIDKEAVIQDDSSQRAGALLTNLKPQTSNAPLHTWDCCAASGGKSIMAKDLLGDIELTVSDIRPSILANLEKRFAAAGIRHYSSMVLDLSQRKPVFDHPFQLIIADVPCSGSGTWGRTPEQLYYFDQKKIGEYAALQKKIISNAVPSLAKGGHLLYITCSVFRQENEANIAVIKKEFQLEEIQTTLYKGYTSKADTLFASLLRSSG